MTEPVCFLIKTGRLLRLLAVLQIHYFALLMESMSVSRETTTRDEGESRSKKVCSMGMVVLMSVSISTIAVGFTWIVFQLPGAEVPVSQ